MMLHSKYIDIIIMVLFPSLQLQYNRFWEGFPHVLGVIFSEGQAHNLRSSWRCVSVQTIQVLPDQTHPTLVQTANKNITVIQSIN